MPNPPSFLTGRCAELASTLRGVVPPPPLPLSLSPSLRFPSILAARSSVHSRTNSNSFSTDSPRVSYAKPTFFSLSLSPSLLRNRDGDSTKDERRLFLLLLYVRAAFYPSSRIVIAYMVSSMIRAIKIPGLDFSKRPIKKKSERINNRAFERFRERE